MKDNTTVGKKETNGSVVITAGTQGMLRTRGVSGGGRAGTLEVALVCISEASQIGATAVSINASLGFIEGRQAMVHHNIVLE